MTYIRLPITAEPADLSEDSIEYLRDNIPGFQANEADPAVILIDAWAQIASDILYSATGVPDEIFRYFGRSVVGIPPVDAAAATGTVTFTAIDTAGYTIPDGTQILGTNADGDDVPFETVGDYTIGAGASTVAGVAVQAVEEGSIANSVNGAGELLDTLDYIVAVTFDAATGGGLEPEDDDVYLGRLRAELALMAPRPILPDDFAVLARRISGVDRAVAIDGLDPTANAGAGSTGNERMVTVAVINEAGTAVSTAIRNQVAAYLDGLREVNFVVHVIDPTLTPINVTFTFTVWPGWDADAVKASAEASVAAFLSPANWGQPPLGDTREWVNDTIVDYDSVAHAILSTEGVRRVTALTVNAGTADVALAGFAPLPSVGTVTGTPA